jgi:hypothetical protein
LRKKAAKAAAREAGGSPAGKPETKPASTAESAAEQADASEGAETHNNVNVSFNGLDDFCQEFKDQPGSDNSFRNNLRERCKRLASGDGSSLGQVVLHNMPRAMFIFLPLLALVMKLMYWRPKRYYVEHLLFLIHNHAFVFLASILVVLIAGVPFLGAAAGWIGAALWFYAMWYIYRAMRSVYGQGVGLTLAKYFTLAFTYVITSAVMLVLTVIYSAMTL